MKFKRIIVALLLLCIAVSMAGCTWKWGFTIDGVTYFYHNCLCVIGINDFETEDSIENIYISDYINDVPVEKFGTNLYYRNPGFIHYSHTERIYFPWTISITNDADYTVEIGKEDVLKYLISASTQTIICEVSIYDSERYVMPNETYNRVLKGEIIGDYYAYQFPIKSENLSMYLPANISYFFNYDESPNENYFFVDLLEETGKLTKPPYDPRREGYVFAGWYTEAECLNSFNFEEDFVTINFDEEGNRIYEEFCLYAKWETAPEEKNEPNIIIRWIQSLFN